MSKIAEFLTLQLNIYGATFRVYDFALWTAVGCMLVLGNINTNKNHFVLPPAFYSAVLLRTTISLLCNLVLHKPSGGI